jgi:hypothetical protein
MNQVLQRSTAAGDGRRIEFNTQGHSASSYSFTVVYPGASVDVPAVSRRALENAVYGYLQAVRALGRTEISASEIAAALSLPITEVMITLKALGSKGVKVAG